MADRLRHAVTLLLVVVALVLGPQIAYAGFGASAAPRQEVGTATMVAPTEVRGTYQCTLGFLEESFSVNIAGFTDSGPAGATYIYTVAQDGRSPTTVASSNRTVSFERTKGLSYAADTWQVTITAKLGGWTSAPYTTSVVCPEGLLYAPKRGNL